MSAMMKIAIAALAAGIAQAKPINVASGPNSYNNPSQASSAWSSSSTAASQTTGGSNSGSQTTGFPVFVSPTASAAAVASLAKAINADLTQVDRLQQLLSVNNEAKVPLTDPKAVHDALSFDFKTAQAVGDGGRILVANEANFPFLVGEGIAGAVAFIEPCGMNSPHTHPRATELLTVVEGQLEVGFVMENGLFAAAAKDINALAFPFNTTLNQFEATIFPQGSIHFQFNPTCERAIFTAALNNADPGTSQIAQNFFTLPDEIVDITLGGKNKIDPSSVDQFHANLPANLVLAVDSCKARCHL
jgi:oxalate decarboxylase/phosphoglucose isomerase-like protein (cupin superfamily)